MLSTSWSSWYTSLLSTTHRDKMIRLSAIKLVLWDWESDRKRRCLLSYFPLSREIIASSLFYRSTYGSWTMRCRIPTNARGTSWRCMTEAARWRTWKPSSAARWPTTWCSARGSGSSACGPTRAAATAASRCSSRPSKNVSVSALSCSAFPSLGGCRAHAREWCFLRAAWALISCSNCFDSLSFTLIQEQESYLLSSDYLYQHMQGFPGDSDAKDSACNAGNPGLDPWVGKIPWIRKWQPTPVFLTGKSPGQRSLVGYNPWGRRVRQDLGTNTTSQYQHMHVALLKKDISHC